MSPPDLEGPPPPHRPLRIELVPPPRTAPVVPRRHEPRWGLATALFLLTLVTTTTLGAAWILWTRAEVGSDVFPWLSPHTLATVWGDPELVRLGLLFSIPALGILLCHELGHYLACRWYRLPATPPYFLPAPIGIGTFGAFIRIRAPLADKRMLFDVGASGPIAGFVALVPFLLWGVALSRPVALAAPAAAPAAAEPGWLLLVPGESLAIVLATRFFHGELPAGTILELHPFGLAAWFGLLATSINLLPLAQLDGGHILYSIAGRLQRRLAFPLWLLLVAAGLVWSGWLLWCLIVLFMGLHHPPVRDESRPLDRPRRLLAGLCLLILVLSFMPVPVEEIAWEPPEREVVRPEERPQGAGFGG